MCALFIYIKSISRVNGVSETFDASYIPNLQGFGISCLLCYFISLCCCSDRDYRFNLDMYMYDRLNSLISLGFKYLPVFECKMYYFRVTWMNSGG